MSIKKLITIGILSTAFYSNISSAEDGMSFGLGVGSIYNGLGMSYGYQSKDSFKYVSLGCLYIKHSNIYGTESNCGVGAGFMTTKLFDLDSDKHAFGAHIGATDNQRYDKVEYFVAPQYVYFFNGINKPGWNIGGSIRIGDYDGKSEVIPGFQVGYQF